MLLQKLYYIYSLWNSGEKYTQEETEEMKEMMDSIINDYAKPFLEWLIENGHIEEIKSEKKSGPDINDYIKYIAETEDPIKTLVDMLK